MPSAHNRRGSNTQKGIYKRSARYVFVIPLFDPKRRGFELVCFDPSDFQHCAPSLPIRPLSRIRMFRHSQDVYKRQGKYKMSAVIDGQVISHEISQKDYDKFLAVDDYHRMKLFSKIFNEVDMKTRPEANKGLGVKIFAALTAGAVVASEVAHGFHHHHSPEFYGERFSGPPHPYFKPGVDTPRDVAIRNFEAQMNQDINEMRRGR